MTRILLTKIGGCRDSGHGKKFIVPMNDNAANSGSVVRRQRLGGVLNCYYRKAA